MGNKSPEEFWYHGEIGFFDNYIIPLVKKLKDCQVFGVSSDECLNYAIRNRNEWKERGEQIVKEMLEEIVPRVEESLRAKAVAIVQPRVQPTAQCVFQQAPHNPTPRQLHPPSSTAYDTFTDIVEC